MADAIIETGAPEGGAGARRGPLRNLERATEIWALLGGLSLIGVVLLNTASVMGAWLFNAPVQGDFELTEMGICIAAFAFLPYCQMTGANVTADIFTQNASPRWRAIFSAAACAVALVFACLLGWRMNAGRIDQLEYNYVTTILEVPHAWAFIPILASLALLAVAAAATLTEALRAIRRG